ELTVPDEIVYDFDGTDVGITFDVDGKDAKCYLIINTMLDEAELPLAVTNGFMGWHYVNKCDTTVYVSGAYDFPVGSGHTITWDGHGSENTSGGYGGTFESFDAVAPGTYSYTIFAYDASTPREKVCNFLPIGFFHMPQQTRMGEFDEAGLPRDNPLVWGNVHLMYGNLHSEKDDDGNVIGPAEGWNAYGPPYATVYKFPLGSDPDDMTALQTTYCTGFMTGDPVTGERVETLDLGPACFNPTDQDIFYQAHMIYEQMVVGIFKWTWLTDGNAVLSEDWGGWDELSYPTTQPSNYEGMYTNDDGYIVIASAGRNSWDTQHDNVYIADYEGNKVAEQTLDDFYTPDNPNEMVNSMVNRLYLHREQPDQIILNGPQTCMLMMASLSRMAAGDDDYVTWINQNGDFILDMAWDPELAVEGGLWNCNTGEYRNQNGGRRDETYWDAQGIVIQCPDYMGLMSFIALTQDGTGICYGKFADDIISAEDKIKKGSGQRVDNGSQFDGMYMGPVILDITQGDAARTQCINWVAQDSKSGIITSEPTAVEEEGRAAFSVDAAYPNPANPTTTIGFTLAEAGHVIVDIYNVAGQKINTLVDDEMIGK
ncbi:hypothetical protein ACFL4V_01755, partial [Candidatus Latescibacterota bacterium]